MFRNTAKTAVLLAGLGGLMVAIGSVLGGAGPSSASSWAWPSSGSPTGRATRSPSGRPGPCPPTRPATRSTSRSCASSPAALACRCRGFTSPPSPSPTPFATGRNPNHAAVAITEGLIAACTWDEIRGVLAHELGRVGNPRHPHRLRRRRRRHGDLVRRQHGHVGRHAGRPQRRRRRQPWRPHRHRTAGTHRRVPPADGPIPQPRARGRPLGSRAHRQR